MKRTNILLFLILALAFIALSPIGIWVKLYEYYSILKIYTAEVLGSSLIYQVICLLFDQTASNIEHNVLYEDYSYSPAIPVPAMGNNFANYKKMVNEIVKIHKPPTLGHSLSYLLPDREDRKEILAEAYQAFHAAIVFKERGNFDKAKKLLEHAKALDPENSDILTEMGEIAEHETNLVLAEHYYSKAVLRNPTHKKALQNRHRTLPLVEEIDQRRFNEIDEKVSRFYRIPENNPGLKRMKKEHYFKHIYHSNAIEGNTLNLAQTRAILETRLAIGGKSLFEQNEVLGLDLAIKYLNSTLIRRNQPILLQDILEIHRRVLGFVDLTEAGRFRQTQVFIADYTPPPARDVSDLMQEFITWLNSEEVSILHPIELAALAHWKLVYIHPFYDGNGRTARLLMNLILMRSSYPPAVIKVEERHYYYEYIKQANEGDVRPFIRFIAHCTEQTIDEYLATAESSSAVLNQKSGYFIDTSVLTSPPSVIYVESV